MKILQISLCSPTFLKIDDDLRKSCNVHQALASVLHCVQAARRAFVFVGTIADECSMNINETVKVYKY